MIAAKIWAQGLVLTFKVDSPVGLSALITFHISALALLGIDHMPIRCMCSGLASLTFDSNQR